MIYLDYFIAELAGAMGARISGPAEGRVTCIATDSRKAVARPGLVFFCLRGERHDGHAYVADLYAHGVRGFVTEQGLINTNKFPEATFFQTENTLHSLQKLAHFHRMRHSTLKCLAITGSNGKTIVKEWLGRALSDDMRAVRSPGSYNSQVGVPLALLHIDHHDQIGLFEAGISKPGEMEYLNRIIAPEIVVLTNLGMAHLENFSDRQALANEKAHLVKGAQQVIFRTDYAEWEVALSNYKGRKTTWSTSDAGADFFYQIQSSATHETIVSLHHGHQTFYFNLPVADAGSLENALTTITTLMVLGMSPTRITGRLDRFTPPAWRMELLEAANNCLLVSDVRNSDLASLASTLDFARSHRHGRWLTLVLTDILQSGIPPAELYGRVARLLREKQVHRLIAIGPEIASQAVLFPADTLFFPSTEAAMGETKISFSNEMVVFKGAALFRLERWVQSRALQSHQTLLQIDLDALEQNFNALKSIGQSGCIAVVKASAYGSGSAEVASVLEFNRVDYLAVAYADEGVRLREAGISTPIMVLNMVFGTDRLMIEHRLEPEIFSFSGLESFIDSVKNAGSDTPFPIHIKLDTGMHRLGFLPHEWPELSRTLVDNRAFVKPATVFSHLAAADNPAHDDFTRNQIALFLDGARQMEAYLGHTVQKHIANTSGVLRFPEARLDLVRFGIGLYGVGDDQLLRPVHRLVSVISQIKQIKKGDSVSYDRSFIAPGAMTIGIVPAGYADGYPRSLSNGKASIWVNGKPAMVLGKICMDMTIIDLTNITALEGDEVELFGTHTTLQQLADASGRIPYELLSNIPARVKRVYSRQA